MTRYLFLGFVTLALVGCKGGSSSEGSSKTEYIFSDASVTRFEQTGGIAQVERGMFERVLLPSAYAASGNVSCLRDEVVSFQADALGNTINIETTCKSSEMLDLDIRQALLESLDGHKLRRTVFGQNPTPCDSTGDCFIDFTSGFVWGQPYEIQAHNGCHEQYTFYADGRVVIDKSSQGGDVSSCDPNYPETANFRFREALMEYDFGSTRFENGSPDYERWCLDNDNNEVCD